MGKTRRDLPVIAFKSQQAWDAWLTSQPADSKGLWLKLAKKIVRDIKRFKARGDRYGALSWLDRRSARQFR